MKVVILGGGLAGCTMAYLCKSVGYDVTLLEKDGAVGGLCRTKTIQGHNYEFGPHILYTSDSQVQQFFEQFVNNVHIKYYPKISVDGAIANDKLGAFPVSIESLMRLPNSVDIMTELYNLNLTAPDFTNFETYVKSRMGQTAYDLFVKNYNEKQWGIKPNEMTASWAKYRPGLKLASTDKVGLFGDSWQGHPGSYDELFRQLTVGVTIASGGAGEVSDVVIADGKVKAVNGISDFDLCISTIPIEQILKTDTKLPYRGIHKVFVVVKSTNALPAYAISFPNTYSFTRVLDYKKHSLPIEKWNEGETSLISFAFPFDGLSPVRTETLNGWRKEVTDFIHTQLCVEEIERLEVTNNYVYPVATDRSESDLNDLLQQAAQISNLLLVGRLGLYSYVSMDTCVRQCLEIFKLVLHQDLKSVDTDFLLKEYTRIRRRQC